MTYHPITYSSKGETKSIGQVLEEAGFNKVGEIQSHSNDEPVRIPAGFIPGVSSELILIRKAKLIDYGSYMGNEYVLFQRK